MDGSRSILKSKLLNFQKEEVRRKSVSFINPTTPSDSESIRDRQRSSPTKTQTDSRDDGGVASTPTITGKSPFSVHIRSLVRAANNKDDDSDADDDSSSEPLDDWRLSDDTNPRTHRSSRLSSTGLSGNPRESSVQKNSFGLCYVAKKTRPAFDVKSLPSSCRLEDASSSQRAELLTVAKTPGQYNILIIGDVVHGRILKRELENYPNPKIFVTIAATPTGTLVIESNFILVLLPLEVIGSGNEVLKTLERLSKLRADYPLQCSVVAIRNSYSSCRQVTELFNLHTLIVQHKLSYYVWCNTGEGSWPGIVERLLQEVRCCYGEGNMSRAAQCSILWPSDTNSYSMQRFLDLTAMRSSQGHEFA